MVLKHQNILLAPQLLLIPRNQIYFLSALSSIVNLISRLLGPNYWVQDVDYEKYSLVVSCENWWILTRTSAWILARDQHLPKNNPELMANLYDKLEAMNVPVDVMFESKHDNCEFDGNQQYYTENANDVFSQINKK